MEQIALIFPGQGAQTVGMGRDLVERFAAAKRIYAEANDVLGFDIAALCFEGPASRLEQTDIQQPAIFVTSMACWEALREAGASVDLFAYSAGLSLGEYTALCVSGCFSFADALRLVRRRGRLMQEAAEASPSGMVSLIGADEQGARQLCGRARGDGVLAPANFNCPGQIVISGDREACERAVKLADDFGLKAVQLAVAGAFHSPLMESAAGGLAVELEACAISSPRLRVAANVDADYHGNENSIRDSLRRQVVQPVLWEGCVRRMIADGVGMFVEVGPGRVLSGLMRKIDRSVRTLSVNSAESVPAAIEALAAPART